MHKLNYSILKSQYCRLINKKPETVEDLIDRVVNNISSVEAAYENNVSYYNEKFKEIILNNYFIPSGRILNNAGSKQSQIASCFVLPIKDNFHSIFDTLKIAADCHRLGGGTGFNFTSIRERGSEISSSEAYGSSGPVSWMKLFNAETSVVMSGGKRRGANIGILSVYHPDILEFVKAKTDYQLKNFNISVLVDDNFIDKVHSDEKIILKSPKSGLPTKEESARKIWNEIIAQIHKTGDPGLLFLDEINRHNPVHNKYGDLDVANPCGEQIMYNYEASFLGSLNLLNFYDENRIDLQWEKLEECIHLAVRFLDNAIDANKYPNKKIETVSKKFRRIGLGVMGFSDLLVRLQIPYASNDCMLFIEKLGAFIKKNAEKASSNLSVEKGTPVALLSGVLKRNIAVTAIAPTGTISMISNCSSGIEPRFAAYYNKNVINEFGFNEIDPILLSYLTKERNVSIETSADLIRTSKYREVLSASENALFQYAHDIPYDSHIKVMAAWQKFIDNGISKTVNIPRNSSFEVIEQILFQAYKSGCKGITVYREGSHERDLLTVVNEVQTIQSKEKTKILQELEHH